VIKLALSGASGRMGVSLLELIAHSEQWQLSQAVVSPHNPKLGQDAAVLLPGVAAAFAVPLTAWGQARLAGADVAIDFSSRESTPALLAECVKARIPLVLATTGLTATEDALIAAAARQIAIVKSANTSVGIALLQRAVALLAKALPETFDIDISDAHHAHKKDAPSGTALGLGASAASARGWPVPPACTRQAGAREPKSIGYASVRAGDIVGEHTVLFAGPSERISVTHVASDRLVFARGALRAAEWLQGQPAGVYSMQDVLGV